MKTVFWIFLFIYFLFSSCTHNFKDMNTDKTGVTENEMKVDYNNLGIPLNIIQQGLYFNYDFGKGKNWPFQLMQNLTADLFCGYMHDCKPLNGGSNNSDYNLQDGWNSTMWENIYAYIFPQIKKSEDNTSGKHPQFYSISKILKVFILQKVTDYYGPIIYTQFGNEENHYVPDSQCNVYHAFFNDLDSAVYSLSKYHQEHPYAQEFSAFDILLDGKYNTWIKLANSLRLRLAIRIAMADPVKAREEAQKALTNSFGVFEEYNEIAALSTENGYTNPLGEINQSWNEAFMNANMESILNGYNDPRKEKFFEPCLDDLLFNDDTIRLKNTFKGIRQGTMFAHTLYSSHSKITITPSTPAILMTAAEIWFLRAEAALRGWTQEDAETCYNLGINTSFAQWGVSSGDYLNSTRKPTDYIDVFNSDFNIKACCQVSPKWEDTDTDETKLEKIITQKWLALFPEGCEAWAEQRRTGYPRLFPVKHNNSPENCIDTETMIRRLSFPGKLKDTDPQLYRALQNLLNGPDHAGTRLWWDTGNNF